jgi:hypothetical protein
MAIAESVRLIRGMRVETVGGMRVETADRRDVLTVPEGTVGYIDRCTPSGYDVLFQFGVELSDPVFVAPHWLEPCFNELSHQEL